MTTQEIINHINNANLVTPHRAKYALDIDTSDWEYVGEIDKDSHRWYIISTLVYKVNGDFIGINGPTELKSESMDFQDTGCEVVAGELEAIPSVTYRWKRDN